MSNRWFILAVLFLARLMMAFQFQSVAALSPLMTERYGLSLADIGLLIGFYMAPGIVIAIPGGAVAALFGDKRVVGGSLVLMLAGAMIIAAAQGWWMLLAGRLLAGIGGVAVNVIMTKMVVDWFAGREISTAMAVFVTSWPAGIALALVILPALALSAGLAWAWWGTAGLIAASLVAFAAFYHPPVADVPAAGSGERVALPYFPLVLAGLVWALYNVALAMVFSFAPAALVFQGWSLEAAASATSLYMLVFSAALPLGGVLADRSGAPDVIIMISMASFVVLMPLVPWVAPWIVTALFVLGAVMFAMAAGPAMALPSRVLTPSARALGMGVFFSIYYLAMMIGPRIAGGLADRYGNPAVALYLGAGVSLAGILALAMFRRKVVGPA